MLTCYNSMALRPTWAVEQTNTNNNKHGEGRSSDVTPFFLIKLTKKIFFSRGVGVYKCLITNAKLAVKPLKK
jgi:hypothetical protein